MSEQQQHTVAYKLTNKHNNNDNDNNDTANERPQVGRHPFQLMVARIIFVGSFVRGKKKR